MVEDARFEDAGDKPLRLKAEDGEDLKVISSLVQDAILPASEVTYQKSQRRFALLLNRFRWEQDRLADAERVQSVLVFDDVMSARSQGVDPKDADMVLSLLSLEFAPGEDGTGSVEITLAGDGAIQLAIESVNATLQDVTRPYVAPSGKTPDHPA